MSVRPHLLVLLVSACSTTSRPSSTSKPIASTQRRCELQILNAHTAHEQKSGRIVGHLGVDFIPPCNRTVIAIGNGLVESIVNDDISGAVVVIAHDVVLQGKPFVANFMYAHLANVQISRGDRVWRGQPIAEVWQTQVDRRWIPHVHLELLTSRGPTGGDPMMWLGGCEGRVTPPKLVFPVDCTDWDPTLQDLQKLQQR